MSQVSFSHVGLIHVCFNQVGLSQDGFIFFNYVSFNQIGFSQVEMFVSKILILGWAQFIIYLGYWYLMIKGLTFWFLAVVLLLLSLDIHLDYLYFKRDSYIHTRRQHTFRCNMADDWSLLLQLQEYLTNQWAVVKVSWLNIGQIFLSYNPRLQ